jgi:hypothetical protein
MPPTGETESRHHQKNSVDEEQFYVLVHHSRESCRTIRPSRIPPFKLPGSGMCRAASLDAVRRA